MRKGGGFKAGLRTLALSLLLSGILALGASGTTVLNPIGLWPLGRIAGSVKVTEKGERLPKKLVVTTLPPRPPAPKDAPQGALDCPVDDKGKWQCPPLPGTTFDLVLSAEGFIPQYRWETKVLAGKTTDLGAVKLERGASVAGWGRGRGWSHRRGLPGSSHSPDGARERRADRREGPQHGPRGAGPQRRLFPVRRGRSRQLFSRGLSGRLCAVDGPGHRGLASL